MLLLFFFPFLIVPCCLFLVGGAFSSPRLAVLSCDLVYKKKEKKKGGVVWPSHGNQGQINFLLVLPSKAPYVRAAAVKKKPKSLKQQNNLWG